MVIAGNGNIGIGTTAPAARLDIDGADSLGTGVSLHIENAAATQLVNIANDGTMTFGGALSGNITFGNTSTTASTTIKSGSGGVIIGSAGQPTTIGDSSTASSATIVQGGSTGGVKIGSTGTALSAIRVCTQGTASGTAGSTIAYNITCANVTTTSTCTCSVNCNGTGAATTSTCAAYSTSPGRDITGAVTTGTVSVSARAVTTADKINCVCYN
jgi:hypothetical protein